MAENYTLTEWLQGKFQLDTFANGGIAWEELSAEVQNEIRIEQKRIAEEYISNAYEERKTKFQKQYDATDQTLKKRILKHELNDVEYRLFGRKNVVKKIIELPNGRLLYEFPRGSCIAPNGFFEKVQQYIENTYIKRLRNDYKYDFISPEYLSNPNSIELHPFLCGEILMRYYKWLKHPINPKENENSIFINDGHALFMKCLEKVEENRFAKRTISEFYYMFKKKKLIQHYVDVGDYLKFLKKINVTAFKNKFNKLSSRADGNCPKAMAIINEVLDTKRPIK